MSKMPSDDVLESLRKMRKRESAQLKTVLELYDMEIHQKLRQRNFLTPEMKKLKLEQWLRFARVNVVLEEDKENAINGKQKRTVVERRHAVTGTMKIGW